MRFLSTDLPSRPETAIPTLDRDNPFRRACTVKKLFDARCPSRYARRNCSLDVRRFKALPACYLRPSAGGVPSPFFSSRRSALRASASFCETHENVGACALSAGMSASCETLRHTTITHETLDPERLAFSLSVDNLRITGVVLHRFRPACQSRPVGFFGSLRGDSVDSLATLRQSFTLSTEFFTGVDNFDSPPPDWPDALMFGRNALSVHRIFRHSRRSVVHSRGHLLPIQRRSRNVSCPVFAGRSSQHRA
jgi:hypothetical protein